MELGNQTAANIKPTTHAEISVDLFEAFIRESEGAKEGIGSSCEIKAISLLGISLHHAVAVEGVVEIPETGSFRDADLNYADRDLFVRLLHQVLGGHDQFIGGPEKLVSQQ